MEKFCNTPAGGRGGWLTARPDCSRAALSSVASAIVMAVSANYAPGFKDLERKASQIARLFILGVDDGILALWSSINCR